MWTVGRPPRLLHVYTLLLNQPLIRPSDGLPPLSFLSHKTHTRPPSTSTLSPLPSPNPNPPSPPRLPSHPIPATAAAKSPVKPPGSWSLWGLFHFPFFLDCSCACLIDSCVVLWPFYILRSSWLLLLSFYYVFDHGGCEISSMFVFRSTWDHAAGHLLFGCVMEGSVGTFVLVIICAFYDAMSGSWLKNFAFRFFELPAMDV